MANSAAVIIINSGKAISTPAHDKTPVEVTGDEFEIALKLFESEAASFANSVIKDPSVRSDYTRKTKAAADELIELVKKRAITPHEAARTANAMRNQILTLARAELTDFGLAISQEIKRNGPPLTAFEDKYATKLYGRSFAELSSHERDAVWMEIAHAAGRSHKGVNIKVRWYGIAGRTFLVASLALSIYNVSTTEDKPRQAAKEGTAMAAGAVGGVAAGAGVVALVSNPGGWVVGVAMFVGAALAGVSTTEAFDYFWPEK